MDGLRELGVLVRRLRMDAGLSGAELARRAGVPQPSVSRAETGRRLADVTVVERLVPALGVDAATAGRLVALARRAYAVPVRRRADAGVSVLAGQFRRLALGAGVVRSFSAAMIPVLLRTPDYARAVAVNRGGDGEWAGLEELPGVQGRSFEFVVAEGALRSWPGSVAMGDQLARLDALSRRPNVRLDVIPWSVALPRLPLVDFTVFGEAAVWAETFTAELTLAYPADVAAYAEGFTAYQQVARSGEEARAVLARVAGDFARISP